MLEKPGLQKLQDLDRQPLRTAQLKILANFLDRDRQRPVLPPVPFVAGVIRAQEKLLLVREVIADIEHQLVQYLAKHLAGVSGMHRLVQLVKKAKKPFVLAVDFLDAHAEFDPTIP